MATSKKKDIVEAGLSNYELRWNDHIPYFTTVFQSLRDLNELTDVTFACEDGIVCAHKLVLSSCSVYLRILFARLGTPHPVIFLKNTPMSLVRHILEFVYCGSVNVSKEELPLVLNLGHSLQIQGLAKLKLSSDYDSSGDKIVDELQKERDKLQEIIASEPPLLPGEVRKSPTYSLHNGKEIEFDSENNNIFKPKISKQSNSPSKVMQNQDKKIKEEVKDQNSKPEKPHQQKSIQKELQKSQAAQKQNQSQKSKPNTKKIKTKIKQENESKFMQKNGSVADIKPNKKAFTDKVENLSKLKPQKFSSPGRTYYRYDPRLKMMIGKYYVDHGYAKVKKYFEKAFGFDVPDETLRKMKVAFLANHNKLA